MVGKMGGFGLFGVVFKGRLTSQDPNLIKSMITGIKNPNKSFQATVDMTVEFRY